MFSVKDRVIVITGGAGFLGMQFAKALDDAGATVVLWDKPGAYFGSLFHNEVDITDEKAVQKAAQAAANFFGKIDVLINNAAMNPAVGSDEAKQMFAPYEEYPIDLWKKEIDADLTGMMICTQAAAKQMMKQGSGVIVNIASEVANIAVDNRIYGEGKFKSIAYITAKSGVLGLTRAWASYLGKYGIRVNTFTPGGMPKAEVPEDFRKRYSSLNMLGRMAGVGEYNGAILFLCSDASSFMTGSQLIMDAGKSAW
ncbi:MAG: SDR family oxidoreductase [Parcubacteria group bacterium]|nr:SDR family oxidoreductase [Parcubacteria group bacterium]